MISLWYVSFVVVICQFCYALSNNRIGIRKAFGSRSDRPAARLGSLGHVVLLLICFRIVALSLAGQGDQTKTGLGEARSSIWSLLCRNSHPLNDFHFNEYHAKAGGIYL